MTWIMNIVTMVGAFCIDFVKNAAFSLGTDPGSTVLLGSVFVCHQVSDAALQVGAP